MVIFASPTLSFEVVDCFPPPVLAKSDMAIPPLMSDAYKEPKKMPKVPNKGEKPMSDQTPEQCANLDREMRLLVGEDVEED